MNLDFKSIIAKMKSKEYKNEVRKFPKFELEKIKTIVSLPEDRQVDITYPLIPPFASANLKYDKENKEIVYNLIEPKLTSEEEKIYKKLVDGLLEVLDVELSAIKRREEAVAYIEEHINQIISDYGIKLSNESYVKIMYFIYRNFIGLNEIEPLMHDVYIEDISCDGVNTPIYVVHRKYGSVRTNIVYNDPKTLMEFVVKISERCGRFISYAEPLLDGTLPDGSRVQASFSKDVTTRGPTFTIRKFVEEPLSPIDLLVNNTANSSLLAYLWLAVESGASILVAGGAGTGKTSFLNAISMFIPPTAKIISIEDTRELNIMHENWIPSVVRPGFAKGYGEVTLFDLLKEAFRQAPDYVIVGEVRGEEAYVLFQGMAAGMPAMGTMHAGKVEDVIHRLETPPINLSPTLVETLDVVIIMVHAREKGESARRVKEVVEIESVDAVTGNAHTNQVFSWQPVDDTFEERGNSWLLQEISKLKGIAQDILEEDLKRRKRVIEMMNEKGIRNFRDVSKVIADYYKNPESFDIEKTIETRKTKKSKSINRRNTSSHLLL